MPILGNGSHLYQPQQIQYIGIGTRQIKLGFPMPTFKIDNFIGCFDNVVSHELCDEIIHYFEQQNSEGRAKTRQEEDAKCPKLDKDDKHIFLHSSPEGIQIFEKVMNIFWNDVYKPYAEKYCILNHFELHTVKEAKVQKTEPGEGYHIWHAENGSKEVADRILAWSLYLNDVDEGGETEFLYQHRRIKAQKGRFVLWPAGLTHVHRGNTPLTNTKYILTGWVSFAEPNPSA